jgi:putative photosynthetic complex assembly protein
MTTTTDTLLRDRSEARAKAEGELIPKGLLFAMLTLVLATVAIVSYGVWSGRSHVGQPVAAAIVSERSVILEGHGAKAVTVRGTDGRLLLDLAHGGFVTVIQNSLERVRFVHGTDQTKPVRLVQYANGRLTIIDPETGWSAELGAFGSDNRAAFERLMSQ